MSPQQRFLFAIVLFTVFGTLPALAQQCHVDSDCNVGKSFCGGEYRCMPGGAGADANGCIRPVTGRCSAGQTCNEAAQRCESSCANPDADGDGHRSQACGGDDCDDHDSNSFPGNQEVWDANDHDEDCNADTHGVPPQLQLVLTDHLQACSGTGVVLISRKLDYNQLPVYDHYRTATCAPGTVCIPQPSGEGVCGAKPENYEVPPVIANIPTGPQQHAANTPATTPQRATPPIRPNVKFNPAPGMRQLGPPNRTQVCPKDQKWDPVTSSCK